MPLNDKSLEQVDMGLKLMDKSLAKDVAKGRLQDGEAREARERVTIFWAETGMASLRDADMVVEMRSCITSSPNSLDAHELE